MNTKYILISVLITIISIPTIAIGGSFVSSLIVGKTPSEAVEIIAEQLDIVIGRTNIIEGVQTNQEESIATVENKQSEQDQTISNLQNNINEQGQIISEQEATINQQQQDIQTIKEDTSCLPFWECHWINSTGGKQDWSPCIASIQTRTCIDSNNCGKMTGMPPETQSCECNPNWECTLWSTCNNDAKTRACHDTHQCGTLEKKPDETIFCEMFHPDTDLIVEIGSPELYSSTPVYTPISNLNVYKNMINVKNKGTTLASVKFMRGGTIDSEMVYNCKLLIDDEIVSNNPELDDHNWYIISFVPAKILSVGIHSMALNCDIKEITTLRSITKNLFQDYELSISISDMDFTGFRPYFVYLQKLFSTDINRTRIDRITLTHNQ